MIWLRRVMGAILSSTRSPAFKRVLGVIAAPQITFSYRVPWVIQASASRPSRTRWTSSGTPSFRPAPWEGRRRRQRSWARGRWLGRRLCWQWRRGRRRRGRRRRRWWRCWIAPFEAEVVLGDGRLVNLRAGQASALVVQVGDHKLETRPDLDEEGRGIRVCLGRWRLLRVRVA